MCGIFFSISASRPIQPPAELLKSLQQRGPDSTKAVQRAVQVASNDGCSSKYHLTFVSTVLALRGDHVVSQPFISTSTDSLLCWNGEAWSIAGEKPDGNDTQQVFDLLTSPGSSGEDENECAEQNLVKRLSCLAGPYAFVYFDAARRVVFFGRDVLGRRSLLWTSDNEGTIIICSVSNADGAHQWREVEANGIYSIHLGQPSASGLSTDAAMGKFCVRRHELPKASAKAIGSSSSVVPSLDLQDVEGDIPSSPLSADSDCVSLLHFFLQQALKQRINNIPLPPHPPLDRSDEHVPRFAVLFSGGLDCTLLARMAHDLVPPQQSIDLLNVAFENPRVHKHLDSSSPYELCPDRITGRASLEELRCICPSRVWRFVAIDVPYTETIAHREQILTLMHPHNTEMDLSISSALYFASRGCGNASDGASDTPHHYTTPARVLLSGLGADELYAGYTRHATAYRRGGRQGLQSELALDVGRLGQRNLGRDDRVMSHWSKEVRFPYLDEAFVSWTLSIPLHQKCGFLDAVGSDTGTMQADGSHLEAGKKALRCLAWSLGMHKVAAEKKRAIQFGARTAKMETGKTKGTTLVQ